MPTFTLTDILTTAEADMLKSDVSLFVADTDVGAVTVVYQRLAMPHGGSAAYSPTTGAITTPYSSKSITALVGAIKDEDQKLARAPLGTSDRKFMIDAADLDEDPQSGDQIVWNNSTYEIMYVKWQAATNLVVLLTRITGGEL